MNAQPIASVETQMTQAESAFRVALRQKNLASLASRGGIEPMKAIRLMAALEEVPE